MSGFSRRLLIASVSLAAIYPAAQVTGVITSFAQTADSYTCVGCLKTATIDKMNGIVGLNL